MIDYEMAIHLEDQEDDEQTLNDDGKWNFRNQATAKKTKMRTSSINIKS